MKEFGETIVATLIISAVITFIGWMGYRVGTSGKPTAMDVYPLSAIEHIKIFEKKKQNL